MGAEVAAREMGAQKRVDVVTTSPPCSSLIIENVPIYELRIKGAAHLEPEHHLLDSGSRIYLPHQTLEFNGQRLRIVDVHRETLFGTSGGTQVVHRLTCIPR